MRGIQTVLCSFVIIEVLPKHVAFAFFFFYIKKEFKTKIFTMEGSCNNLDFNV